MTRAEIDDALEVLRGDRGGDRVKATRVVTTAGFDPARISSSAERRELAARMGDDSRPKTIHWEGNDLVFPTLTKQEALAFLASRGLTPTPAGSVRGPSETERVEARARLGYRR